ncbi:SdpI family protein [Nonomuraea wenchangensis]|uniref:SdpI family protein n=1 Tax=Nonomuraea wenchangensis TaxID=568860 RepID=UPI00331C0C73
MWILPLVVLLGGLVLGVVGYLGLVGRLPRNDFAGVRTATTMRSDATFLAANRAAGPPTLAGGGVGLVGAVVAWLMPGEIGVVTASLVALAVMTGLTVLGAVKGVRAAKAVVDPR